MNVRPFVDAGVSADYRRILCWSRWLTRGALFPVYQLISRRRFQQMDVLEGQNILITVSGKKSKIRVYYLSWLKTKIFKTEGVSSCIVRLLVVNNNRHRKFEINFVFFMLQKLNLELRRLFSSLCIFTIIIMRANFENVYLWHQCCQSVRLKQLHSQVHVLWSTERTCTKQLACINSFSEDRTGLCGRSLTNNAGGWRIWQ